MFTRAFDRCDTAAGHALGDSRRSFGGRDSPSSYAHRGNDPPQAASWVATSYSRDLEVFAALKSVMARTCTVAGTVGVATTADAQTSPVKAQSQYHGSQASAQVPRTIGSANTPVLNTSEQAVLALRRKRPKEIAQCAITFQRDKHGAGTSSSEPAPVDQPRIERCA